MVSTSRVSKDRIASSPQPALSAAAQAGGPQLLTETKFMQQYRIGAAVHGGGDLAALQNGSAAVEVFTVGTDTQVWDFFADPSSDTGMLAAPTALSASRVTAGRDRNGRIVLFAANHLALNYVVENAPGSSNRWGAMQTATLPLPQGAITIAEIYAGQIGAALYVGALIQTQNAGPSPTYAFVYSIWDDSPGVFASTTMTLSSLNCLWSGCTRATAEFTCLDGIYLGYDIDTRQVIRYPVAATFATLSVATVVDRASNNQYFAILNDGNLYQLVGGHGTTPFSWAQLTQQRSFRQVAASLTSSGDIHLLALGGNANLWHLSPLATSPTGFSNPMVIQTNVALMTVTALDQGGLQLFLVSTAQATMLQMIWQAAAGNWQTTPVQVPTSGQVEAYTAYATDLQIRDAAGSPVPQAVVQIRASSQTQITVNGSFYTIDADTPATLAASASGTMTVAQQTNTLAIPSLSFDIANVTTSSIAVQQFAGVQDRLATVTGAELMDAKTEDGSYLLAEQYRTPQTTDSLAQACNQTMAIAAVNGATLHAEAKVLTRQRAKAGVGALRSGSLAGLHRIVVGTGDQPPHWQLDASTGQLQYRALTADQAAALLLEKRARHADLAAAGGFLDWVGSIGDFITGVAEGVVAVIDTVITAVGDALHAVITFIADGVEYLFDTIVEFVEQAFDLVEVFFAQVKVFFGELFEWLGFLFNWNDILRTHTALSYTVNQFLTFLPLSVAGLQRIFDSGIATVQSEIAAAFDQLVALVGGDSLGGYVDGNEPSEPTYAASNSNNIILAAALENAGGASFTPLSPSTMGPFDVVLQQLQQLVDTVEADPAFQQALDYMTNLGGSLDQIFVQLVSALLRVVQGLVQAMIAGVQAVVDALLQLVESFIAGIQATLNEQWNIPFITTFYAWLTNGASLTLLDLISLLLAIPATILYKATQGAAPFPDDASVAAFEASFTAQTMLANSGLGAREAPALVRARTASEQQSSGLLLLQISGALSFSAYGLLSAALDVKPMTGAGVVDPLTKTLTQLALAGEIIAQAVGCPWIYGTTAPNCSDASGVGAWFWIYEAFGVVLDAGFAWYDDAFPENNDTVTGVVVAVLFGAGHALLTAVVGGKLSGLGLASKIVLVIPECCKFLRLPQLEASTEGLSLVVLAALDGLCIPASGLMSFADSIAATSAPSRQLAPGQRAG